MVRGDIMQAATSFLPVEFWRCVRCCTGPGWDGKPEQVITAIEESSYYKARFNHPTGVIRFGEYLKLYEDHKAVVEEGKNEADLLDSYIAMGGDDDGGGCIDADNLRNACKKFELAIDIDKLIEEVDEDGSGEIEFGEWKAMFGGVNDAAPDKQKVVADDDMNFDTPGSKFDDG